MSSVAIVLPQIFHVAFDVSSLSRNQGFLLARQELFAAADLCENSERCCPHSGSNRRMSAVISPAGVENLKRFLRNELRESLLEKRVGFGAIQSGLQSGSCVGR